MLCAPGLGIVLRHQLGLRGHRLGELRLQHLGHLLVHPTRQRKRRPDVACVSYDRWPPQQRVPRTEAWDVVPTLAVEVVSPTDRAEDLMPKVTEYFRAGVERVWVLFPAHEHVYVYASPTTVRILTRADAWHGEPILPHFRLPLAAFFDDVM